METKPGHVRKAMFGLSGDPITLGHISHIEKIAAEYDEVHVGFGINPDKNPTFSLQEREMMAKHALSHLPNVKVVAFPGLLVDYAFEQDIHIIEKGVRNSVDVEYEHLLDVLGKTQIPDIKTKISEAQEDKKHISSSSAKAMIKAQGFIHTLVTLQVKQMLEARINGQYMLGFTGEPACGKSYFAKKLEEIAATQGYEVYNIELDHIGHDILGKRTEPKYVALREEIAKTFGGEVMDNSGFIDRKRLGEIVFGNRKKLDKLDDMIFPSLMVRLRKSLYGRKGLFMINAALLAEADLLHLVNNNVVGMNVDDETQRARMKSRNLDDEQIKRRLESQFSYEKKKEIVQREIEAKRNGKFWDVDSSKDYSESQLENYLSDFIKELDVFGELRFRALWNRLKADGTPDEEYAKLVQTYNQHHRHYHNLAHLVMGINAWQDHKHLMKNPDQVLFAWYFHDYVMKKQSKVDEERSAQHAYSLAKQMLLPEEFAQAVKDLVLVTKHDREPKSVDEMFMLDIDLMIFGSSTETFEWYDQAIREEWKYVSPEKYALGRQAILRRFECKNPLYRTDAFREKYEGAAKVNLKKAISRLDDWQSLGWL